MYRLMMLTGLFLFTFLLTTGTLSLAEDSKPLELPDFSNLKKDLEKEKKKDWVKTNCQTSTGEQIASGEPGYDECMQDAAGIIHNRFDKQSESQ